MGSSEIRSDADVFHEASNASHSLDVNQNAREVELASVNGFTSEGLNAILEKTNIRVRSNQEATGPAVWTYSEHNRMGSLISLDGDELFDSELGVRESRVGKVFFFELGKGLGIKLGLELFQNVGECYERKGGDRIEVSSAARYDRKHKTKTNRGEGKTKEGTGTH